MGNNPNILGPGGSASDDLGDTPVVTANGYTSSGFHGISASPNASGVITLPGVGLSASNPGFVQQSRYTSWTGGYNSVYLDVYPITLNLPGTTPDSSGNLNILVGQGCTASLPDFPTFPLGTTVTYQWSVSGTTFQSWTASSPTNQDASYYVDGPGPLTNSTAAWYWNDNTSPHLETVSCAVTVTPPAGQGSVFTVTATQNVTVCRPTLVASGIGGSMQVGIPFYEQWGNYWLWAGPVSGSGETSGMDWYAHIYPPSPNPASFGSGNIILVQLVTPGENFTSTGGDKYHSSYNGQQGLDTDYPYGWATGAPDYFSGDSPGLNLTAPMPDTIAYSASLQDQFDDYIMYLAPGSAQYVPLGRFVWKTHGNATMPFQGGTYNLAYWTGGSAGTVTPSGPGSVFTRTNTFPMWTQVVMADDSYWVGG